MSAIDVYDYTCLGIIECPTPYRFFGNNDIGVLHVPIYRLNEDIPEDDWDFGGEKTGDIMVGGGSGEAPAMSIAMPEALLFFTALDRFEAKYPDGERRDTYNIHWLPAETYKLGAGFETLGWNPENASIEGWLIDHVLSFLIEHYRDDYTDFIGDDPLYEDGSICRLIKNENEDRSWNWRKYKE
ncbi:MAG: hypothetical protein ACPG7F_09675 [Aggregatilineales bacterium]